MKKMVCCVLAVALMLCGCSTANSGGETGAPHPTTTPQQENDMPATDDNGMWQVKLLFAETAETLAGTQAVVQYSGEVETVETNDSPQSGHVFLLLELLIEKMQNGNSSFSWADAYVEDSSGNRYLRHENDTFLTSYNLPRLKSVELKIGANQGFACYEIPEVDAAGDLWFVYDGAEGMVRIKIVF